MRVIAGIARGRRLEAPKGLATRPMPDRVRTSLFDALGPHLVGARVLDLYAGAGSVGIEALSRGAAGCLFVDRSPEAAACARANLDRLGLAPRGEVWTCEASSALARLARTPGRAFELIFLDPPFELFGGSALAGDLAAAGPLLAADGRLVLRFETGTSGLPTAPEGLRRVDHRTYGRSTVVVWARAGGTEEEAHGAL